MNVKHVRYPPSYSTSASLPLENMLLTKYTCFRCASRQRPIVANHHVPLPLFVAFLLGAFWKDCTSFSAGAGLAVPGGLVTPSSSICTDLFLRNCGSVLSFSVSSADAGLISAEFTTPVALIVNHARGLAETAARDFPRRCLLRVVCFATRGNRVTRRSEQSRALTKRCTAHGS